MPSAGPCPAGVEPSDLSVCDGASTFLQSGFWGGFKARFGWEARPFLLRWEGADPTPLLALIRPLAPGFAFAYVPWGPQLPLGSQLPLAPPVSLGPQLPSDDASPARILAAVAGALRPHLRKNIGFIRFDPPWYSRGPGVKAPAMAPPLVKAGADVQAPDTVLLDLGPPPEAILAGMKDKWRYNIGLAARRGVTVRQFRFAPGKPPPEPAGGPAGILGADLEQALGVFYTLLEETARRDGIAIHHIDYYRGLFLRAAHYQAAAGEAAGDPGHAPVKFIPDVRLYLAEYQDQPLAGIVTLFRGREGVYLYGASSGLRRNLMAPYALQWAAIRDAREAGCAVYDFFGIPPSGDPGHPMAGLYRFKTGFIGNATDRIIHRSGSWDYPCRPVAAGLFKTAETWRKRLRDLKKKHPPAL